MDIRQHGDGEAGADFGENRQALTHANPARGRQAGAVGLVEATFVDQGNFQLPRHLDEGRGNFKRMIAALDLARSGDQRKGPAIAERDRPDRDGARFRQGAPAGPRRQ